MVRLARRAILPATASAAPQRIAADAHIVASKTAAGRLAAPAHSAIAVRRLKLTEASANHWQSDTSSNRTMNDPG
jgi:hypothetical protein